MSEKLYRIEEFITTGWEVVEPQYRRLTREQASNVLNSLIEDGYNPNRLRATVDVDES